MISDEEFETLLRRGNFRRNISVGLSECWPTRLAMLSAGSTGPGIM